MVLLYPKPTIFTKHTIVPTDAVGTRVATLLESDDKLRLLEMRHGFRTNDAVKTSAVWKSEHIDLPGEVIDVVEPPSFKALEAMIGGVASAFDKQ